MKKMYGWVVAVKGSTTCTGYTAPNGLGAYDPDKHFHLVLYLDKAKAERAAVSMHSTDGQQYSVQEITIEVE